MSEATAAVPAWDIRAWSEEARKRGSLVVLAMSVVLLGVGYFLQWNDPDTAGGLLIAFTVLLVLLFAFEAGVLYYGTRPRSVRDVTHPAPAEESPYAPPPLEDDAPMPEEGGEEDVLTLKCSECGTIFDLTDTGQRPLYHQCPGCGAEGMLRGDFGSEPEEEEPAPDAAAEPLEEKPVKRLKVRCGGCKNVLQIEDTGTRPLRHRCPECGKLGEIR